MFDTPMRTYPFVDRPVVLVDRFSLYLRYSMPTLLASDPSSVLSRITLTRGSWRRGRSCSARARPRPAPGPQQEPDQEADDGKEEDEQRPEHLHQGGVAAAPDWYEDEMLGELR